MKWIRTGKTINAEGTTITYELAGNTGYTIESRKRHIPHAGGKPGTWDHTSYFVLIEGQELVEKFSLQDAKDYVMALTYTED